MERLATQAAFNGSLNGFAKAQIIVSSSQSLRCLVQCTPDILGAPCTRCLNAALNQRDDWSNTRVFLPSCFFSYDLYGSPPLPIAPPPSGLPARTIVAIVVPSVVVVAGLIGSCIFLFRRYQKKQEEKKRQTGEPETTSYKYEDLARATNGFSEEYVIGKGGFGKVYKAKLLNGDVVAVKKLNPERYNGDNEFQAEINTLGTIHSRHLVRLLSCCIHDTNKLLVYEYMENNSLSSHLHPKEGSMHKTLSWPIRKKIALGAANGVAYLHHSCDPRIIHRDIKSSNILLDATFEAKISDFGLARFIEEDETHVTTQISGTFGFIAPEIKLGKQGEVSEKTDVYAFGVVLLELISGEKPAYVDWAADFINKAIENDGNHGVDSKMGTYDLGEMRRMYNCAVSCVHVSVENRPTMEQIVGILEEIVSTREHNLMSRFPSVQQGVAESQEYDTGSSISSLPTTSTNRFFTEV